MAESFAPTVEAVQARIAAVRPAAYARELPADIRHGYTGVPVVDEAVRTLYATGALHNHARMWLASYVVHVRKVNWRTGADWLYGHLLDGDLASNHLSWQWVAGTGSRKPYLFNADNVARHAPSPWHSPGSVIDTSYEALDRMAREPGREPAHGPAFGSGAPFGSPSRAEPQLGADPPDELGLAAPDPAAVNGRDVWLVHPWSLREPPALFPRVDRRCDSFSQRRSLRCGPRCRAGAGWPSSAACQAWPGRWNAPTSSSFAGGRPCNAGSHAWIAWTCPADLIHFTLFTPQAWISALKGGPGGRCCA